MSEDAAKPEPRSQGRRFWLTIGEVVAVLGLGLAALVRRDVGGDLQAAVDAAWKAEAPPGG